MEGITYITVKKPEKKARKLEVESVPKINQLKVIPAVPPKAPRLTTVLK